MKNYSDILIVDSAAGISRESLALMESSDELIVVSNADKMSIDNTKQVLDAAGELKKRVLGLIVNKYTRKRHGLEEHEIFKELQIPVLGWFPHNRKFEKAKNKSQPLIISHPNSKISKKFKDIASVI